MTRRIRSILLAWFESHPGDALKTKDLARAVQLPKQGDDYLAMKDALRRLQEERRIERVEGRKWRLYVEERTITGTFRPAHRGGGVVVTDAAEPSEIAIPPSAVAGASPGDRVRVRYRPSSGGRRPLGIVVEILEHGTADPVPESQPGRAELVGVVDRVRGRLVVHPDAVRGIRDVEVSSRAAGGARGGEARGGDKVIVRITGHDDATDALRGEIVTILGRAGDPQTENAALERRHGLPRAFPADVEQEAQDFPSLIPQEELAHRLDLRDVTTFTIDPEDAKDFDDAVSIGRDQEGNYTLGVHIADVSHYVRAGTALDREAQHRGTSVYLVERVVPMLPERLSNHLCSLQEGMDRLTYSVLMTVSPRGAVKGFDFRKAVIRSRRRFSYEEVEDIIASGEGPFAGDIAQMHALATVLMKKRFREGSIDFAVPEVKFRLSPSGYPLEIVAKERLRSMRLVEEFMLLANKTVATAVRRLGARDEDLPFVYRVHDLPDPDKVRELTEFIRHLGLDVRLDPKSSQSFQRMIESLRDRPESAVVQDVTIRSMAKAVYSEKNIGHFGLGFSLYTHFTSPIRRYPDLIVHRLLHEFQQGNLDAVRRFYRGRVAAIAKQSSERERAAVEAERESVKLKQVEYMQRHLGDEFDAVISGVTQYGLYVELVPTLVEGLVHIRTLSGDYFAYDARKKSLVGRRTGTRYRLGDRVRVQVVRVDLASRQLDFQLAP